MILRIVLIFTLAAWGLLSQEHGGAQPEHKQGEPAAQTGGHDAGGNGGHESGDPLILWKWVNFAMLAGALGWLMGKHLPAFFKERNDEIQTELAEARRLKAEADARASEVELRMSRMETEIESLRAGAKKEMTVEGERIGKETEELIKKVRAAAENEITAIAKAARIDLKNQSAILALELAEQRIRGRVQGVDAELVSAFIRDLDRKGALN